MKKHLSVAVAAFVGYLFGAMSLGVVAAQGGPFTAQIENFWRIISSGGRTFQNLSAVNATVTGTCTGCGTAFSGTQAQWVRGDASTSQTMVGGTVVASTPWALNQTWSNAGVTFDLLDLNVTNTNSNNLSNFIVGNVGGVAQIKINRLGSFLGSSFQQLAGNGAVAWTGSAITLQTNSSGHAVRHYGGNPTVNSGFGSGPSVLGASRAGQGRINVGTGGVATSGVLNIPGMSTTDFVCLANDENSNILTRVTPGAGTLTFTAASAWTASDVISWFCVETV
jgi:hypothetical protein